jgi:branched-chain amino acid transport system ATP-binding protein
MLRVESVEAAYGDSKVLFGVDLTVAAGEVVTLLGRNGMGKTTTVRSIFGLVKSSGGRILLDGDDMTGKPPHLIARRGLGLVPEGRQVFPTLTVEENLIATSRSETAKPKWTLPSIYALFPRLAERRGNRGNQLSGGEQQMLAIGRALMTNPRLIVLDEATEGLAPLIREEIWRCLAQIKREGDAILLIDKNVDALAKLADRHVVMEKGRIAWAGSTQDLLSNADIKNRYLHV